jgi:hypothetical protein
MGSWRLGRSLALPSLDFFDALLCAKEPLP